MIYLRYVAKLLNGEGWVYNPGDWVNGSTSTSTGNTPSLVALGFLCGKNWLLAQTLAFALGLGTALFALLRLFAPKAPCRCSSPGSCSSPPPCSATASAWTRR